MITAICILGIIFAGYILWRMVKEAPVMPKEFIDKEDVLKRTIGKNDA